MKNEKAESRNRGSRNDKGDHGAGPGRRSEDGGQRVKATGLGSKALPGGGAGGAMKGVLELWWASLSASEKTLALQITLMMEDVEGDKRIEIRRELKQIRVRFIQILKQPEKGCLSAIMLPEASGRGWN